MKNVTVLPTKYNVTGGKILSMILKDTLTEYRNGNTNIIIEKIYSNYMDNDNCMKIKILDKELERTIKRTYNDYIQEGISRRKRVNAVFNGDIDDMTEMFISELYSLYDDVSFEPADESAIFKALKYNVVKRLNQELQYVPVTMSMEMTKDDTNDDDEEFEFVPDALIYYPFKVSAKSGYSGTNKELLNVIKSVDVEQLCRNNADVQINVANLIKKYYIERDSKYPTLEKMLDYYKSEYGCEISKDTYSRALNNLFSLICDNTTSFKGLDINRRDYISRYDSEGNVKPAIVPLIDYCCLSSDNMLSLINIVNQLEDYIPETVTGDKFYNIVQQDNIKQLCYKYKRLARILENLDNLSVEDYSDVLGAVYIMLNEYVREHIKYQLDDFLQRFSENSIDTDFDTIYNLAIGRADKQGFWSLYQRKDGLHILSFIQSENNIYVALKGKADIKVDCKMIYQIGKCKFIISEDKVYCRSAYKELINIRCVKNRYSACLLTA